MLATEAGGAALLVVVLVAVVVVLVARARHETVMARRRVRYRVEMPEPPECVRVMERPFDWRRDAPEVGFLPAR